MAVYGKSRCYGCSCDVSVSFTTEVTEVTFKGLFIGFFGEEATRKLLRSLIPFINEMSFTSSQAVRFCCNFATFEL